MPEVFEIRPLDALNALDAMDAMDDAGPPTSAARRPSAHPNVGMTEEEWRNKAPRHPRELRDIHEFLDEVRIWPGAWVRDKSFMHLERAPGQEGKPRMDMFFALLDAFRVEHYGCAERVR